MDQRSSVESTETGAVAGVAVSYQDILSAAAAIDGAVERTPFRHSRTLSEITGAEVHVKFESFQYTASFKERGALYRLLALSDAEKARGVVAMSAGNHAQGVAYHALRLGIPATVVMPKFTSFNKVRQTEALGAKVNLDGEFVDEAADVAQALADRDGLTFVHPFDDEKVIAGQGTIALEMLAERPDLEIVVVPVGGGGLIAGMAIAAKHLRPDIEIVGVEAEAFPNLRNLLEEMPIAEGGSTIAEGIAVKNVGALATAVAGELVDEVLLVSETELERAIILFFEVEKVVAEGAGAAGLAALLAHAERFRGRQVGLILTGGNIDAMLLANVIQRGLVRDGRVVGLRIELPDVPGALAGVARVIGEQGANIIETHHQRIFSDISAKSADIDIVVEMRDAEQLRQLLTALSESGYTAHLLGERRAAAN